MARSLWTGSISFGLIYIPVKLYSAVSHKEVRFHNVHVKDGARIREKRICSKEKTEVDFEDVAKGYQLGSKMVVLTQEEIQAADPEASRTIQITDFVTLSDIDPIYFLDTYYIAPDPESRRSYGLLREAMLKTNQAAIATLIMRQNQYLAVLHPKPQAIMLSTMLYADEIVPAASIPGLGGATARTTRAATKATSRSARTKTTAKEQALAQQLIKQQAGGFRPSTYKDTHRQRLLALIRRKAKGQHVVPTKPTPRKRTHVEELLRQLEESVNAKARR